MLLCLFKLFAAQMAQSTPDIFLRQAALLSAPRVSLEVAFQRLGFSERRDFSSFYHRRAFTGSSIQYEPDEAQYSPIRHSVNNIVLCSITPSTWYPTVN